MRHDDMSYVPPGSFNPYDYEYAITYGRFSSPVQAIGESRARQEEETRATAERFGWELLDQFFDPGTSGGRGKQRALGALSEIIRRLNAGLIPPRTVLIVETFDRLSRELITIAQEQFLRLINRSLGVYTTMDGAGYDKRSMSFNPGQMFNSLGLMLSANSVYRIMADRGLKGFAARRGRKTAACPGWLIFERTSPLNKPMDGEYHKKDRAADLILRMAREAEYMGLDKIAARLNSEKIEPFEAYSHGKRPRVWYDSHIHRILTGRAIRGELQVGRMKWVERTIVIDGESYNYEEPKRELTGETLCIYPEIISEEQWQRTRAALDGRKTGRGRKGAGFPNLFQGLAKCAHCGGAMWYKSTPQNGKPYARMMCYAATRLAACDNTLRFDYALVEREFLDTFDSIIRRFLQSVIREDDPVQPIRQLITNKQKDLLTLDGQIEVTRQKLRDAAKKLGRSEGDADEMTLFVHRDDRKKLVDEIAKLERSLAQTEAIAPAADVPQQVNEQITRLQTMPVSERYAARSQINAQLKRFIARIDLASNGTVIVLFGQHGKPYNVEPHHELRPNFMFRFTPEGVFSESRYRAEARVEAAPTFKAKSGLVADSMGGFGKPPILFDKAGRSEPTRRPTVKRSPADEIISAEIDKRHKV